MSLTGAFLRSWPLDPWLIAALSLTTGVYLRGWLALRCRVPGRWHSGQPAMFLGGLAAIWLALASPVDPFAALFLRVHMVQHLLLMMLAPPLIWLGDPLLPMLYGMPTAIRRYWVAPCFRSRRWRRPFERLSHPVTAWLLYFAATWLWHIPAFYDLALRSSGWHYVQHLTFLATALLFWYPVVRPYPSRPTWSRWLLIPYLILADVQNTVLAALLTFSDRVLYPYYAELPRLGGSSALEDQAAAGVIMWVPGSLAFLLPMLWMGTRSLFRSAEHPTSNVQRPTSNGARSTEANFDVGCSMFDVGRSARLESAAHASRARHNFLSPRPSPQRGEGVRAAWDLLRLPGLGRFVRWRHARLCFQIPLLLLAAAVIYDGLAGPAVGPMNLAGVLPWIHWRGALMLGLLVIGNVFCFACPFMLPRALARRLLPQPYRWPRWLRNKWLAVLMVGLFLWGYEVFALWDSPWWTAWIAIGYFAGAAAIDGLFRGAAFCKYVCPIGQFNFVQSLISPWEIRPRDPHVCTRCATKDCIHGTPSPQRGEGHRTPSPLWGEGRGEGMFAAKTGRVSEQTPARGCELQLFVPQKSSNLDCTLCLDCVRACPHENVGLIARAPAAELWGEPGRRGASRSSKSQARHSERSGESQRRPARRDLAALVLILVFGAFANAAGMVAPVAAWQDTLRVRWGLDTSFWPATAYYLMALVALPLAAATCAAALCRWCGRLTVSRREIAARMAYALVPLGFAMWLSHYSFHLLTSYDAAIPATQRFVASFGGDLGAPDWVCACCRPVGNWLPRLEIVLLDLGLLLSLYAGWRIARAWTPSLSDALRSLAPWAALIVLLFAAGVWIVLQPMQMRGTLPMAGG